MKEIKKYVEILKDRAVKCKLCPNNCLIALEHTGMCGVRKNVEGKLYSTVYGYPCSISIDPIEKKPLYHFFPGQKILSIGTFGCNLFCKGCQNFDITRHDTKNGLDELEYVSPKEIVNLAVKNKIDMIAYTYNEPTIFFEYMIDIAKLAKEQGIKNVIVSNGYINPEPLKELCKYIDAANIDLKGITDKFYKEYTGTKLNPILATIKYIHDTDIWLELTNLLIPGLNDSENEIDQLCEWITTNLGKDTPLHFSRFHPYYRASEIKPTPAKSLTQAKNIALGKGMKYVYVGNLGYLENTSCNKCDTILIERDYSKISVKNIVQKKGKSVCKKCNEPIVGNYF